LSAAPEYLKGLGLEGFLLRRSQMETYFARAGSSTQKGTASLFSLGTFYTLRKSALPAFRFLTLLYAPEFSGPYQIQAEFGSEVALLPCGTENSIGVSPPENKNRSFVHAKANHAFFKEALRNEVHKMWNHLGGGHARFGSIVYCKKSQ
jgi:hypothetical protein